MDNKNPTRVLIVEDESIVALDIQSRIEQLSYEVIHICQTAESAIEVTDNEKPDIILMDIKLKGDMDGVTAAEKIRQRHSIPIVFLTAFADSTTFERAKVTDAFGYILKPFQERELQIAIEMALYKHRMNTALKKSQKQLAVTIESIGDGVISTDEEYRINMYNKAAAEYLERNENEFLSQNIDTVLKVSENQQQVMGNTKFGYIKRKKNTYLPVEYTKRHIVDEAGTVHGYVYVFRDITERLEIEEALKRAKTEAEETARAKSEFLANMSHELRTPLNSIIGMTELSLDLSVDKEQQEYLGIAQQSARSLLDIIVSILDFSKIEARKVEVIESHFNLLSVVEDCLDKNSVQAAKKGIKLLLDRSNDCPLELVGDYRRLKQIIINLVSNAIKFTEEGRVLIRLEKSGETEGIPVIGIIVSDTGIGIKPDDVNTIFESFTQINSSYTRSVGGTGLGLAISKGLTELLGGDISVSSEYGKGSTFRIDVPFKIAESQGEKAIEPSFSEGWNAVLCIASGTEYKVLEKILRRWGLNVIQCSSPADSRMFSTVDESKTIFFIDDTQENRTYFYEEHNNCREKLLSAYAVIITNIGSKTEKYWSQVITDAITVVRPIKEKQLKHRIIEYIDNRNTGGEERITDTEKAFQTEPIETQSFETIDEGTDIETLPDYFKTIEALLEQEDFQKVASQTQYFRETTKESLSSRMKGNLFRIVLSARKEDKKSIYNLLKNLQNNE